MTSDVQAVQARLDEAEREARGQLLDESSYLNEWARDRLRLIERDRATLERHAPDTRYDWQCGWCSADETSILFPCPDTRAVIDYWLDEETRHGERRS